MDIELHQFFAFVSPGAGDVDLLSMKMIYIYGAGLQDLSVTCLYLITDFCIYVVLNMSRNPVLSTLCSLEDAFILRMKKESVKQGLHISVPW